MAQFEWAVKNKKVEIFLDDKNILKTSFNNPSALITGLNFIANKLCETICGIEKPQAARYLIHGKKLVINFSPVGYALPDSTIVNIYLFLEEI